MVFFTGLNAFCSEGYVFYANDKLPAYSQSLQISNLPCGEYLKYYNFNTEEIGAEFINLSSSEENRFFKTLSKEEKENYKYVKKIQKIISQGDWNKVFTKYPNYLPAYLQYYNIVYDKGDYNEALRILTKIKSIDRKSQLFNPRIVNQSFGVLYFATGQYTMALNYFKLYENSADDFITRSIANCYYLLGNYTTAIEYCKKLSVPEYHDKELLYSAYHNIKNEVEANKLAKELLKENYCYDNLARVAASDTNSNVKLEYSYKARSVAQNDSQIVEVNHIISDLEQTKLEKSATKLTQFVKIPKWSDFEKQLPKNVSVAELTQKQDEFFKNANLYLTKYTGQQLTNAFNSLNQDYTNYVQNKKNEYYQQQQLDAQKALLIEQQRNNMLQQEIIREQQIRNYIERQYFYMSRPYYYHYRPKYYVWL